MIDARRNIFVAVVTAATLIAFVDPATAQNISLDFGEGGSASARIIQLVLLLTVITLAPSILVMATSFTRIVVVLSILRTALGTQSTPPNSVVVSLALFLTAFIMLPTLEAAYNSGIEPLINEEITEAQAIERSIAPLHAFMLGHVREKDLDLFLGIAKVEQASPSSETPLRALVPAFMISELRRAFEIGFLLFVPFLVIDMVVASVLMSMGMMMLPPVMISLPFCLTSALMEQISGIA
jgi:flagellar biosynthesis protein FliP